MKYAGADWLQNQINHAKLPYQLSPLARDVADILGQVEEGLYHWENVTSAKGWRGGDNISLNYPHGFYGNSLTILILLCHSKNIQVSIRPCSPTAIKLSFVRAMEQKSIQECIKDFSQVVEAIA